MASSFNDLIHTNLFTPREHQVELLYLAKEKNIIICSGKIDEQTFITNKLIQELAINNRKSLCDNGKRTVYLLDSEQSCDEKAVHIERFTDLKVLLCSDADDFNVNEFHSNTQVLVLTVGVCCQLLSTKKIIPSQVNLLIIDKCHNLVTSSELKCILETFRSCDNDTKIIGFAVPLYSLTKEPGRLSFEIERIESLLRCKIETASDLLSILRYSPSPREYMLAYKIESTKDIENYLQDCIRFLQDHCYDPTEIYSEEFLEGIQKIPDPRDKPLELIQEFVYILETLGLWAADRAALIMLQLIEKLKIETSHDRHCLLLGIVTTLFVKIRATCNHKFDGLTEVEQIYKFSTPKVHKLLEVLKTFSPSVKQENLTNNNEKTEVEDQNNLEKQAQRPAEKIEPSFKKYSCYPRRLTDPDLFCGVIFVDNTMTAKVLSCLLNELSRCDDTYSFLSPLYTSDKTNNDILCEQDTEMVRIKQEKVLKKFRIHECNLLISTSVLEYIDIPKCNFVMRFDFPEDYQSYVQCKSRACATDALYILLVPDDEPQKYVQQLAHYHYIEKILLAKCSNKKTNELEEVEADAYCSLLPEYKPLDEDEAPKVTLNSAISLINKYCARLPSDTFTKLTPEWKINPIYVQDHQMYICSLRLPINSSLKYSISSYPMPNKVLAKRLAALQLCIRLHKENEIDDSLIPVSKENFKANPEDAEVPVLPDDEKMDTSDPRPGTAKRRQYYYKKIADALTDCKPEAKKPCYLYHIHMMHSYLLSEERNTRDGKNYPPEESSIGLGILTCKKIPKICPFPIYTRSSEMRVDLKLSKETVLLDETQMDKVMFFLNYTFTNVLRLQKCLMLFDPNGSENSYIIVPVKKLKDPLDICVDWNLLEYIYANRNTMPNVISEEERRNFTFDADRYHDAVITPWYRNQDQPEYFYVAEICNHLNPKSSFPVANYSTFEEYYLKKYCIKIQNLEQPLLDVDYASTRINFLTPRYVNFRGVAMPARSEKTERAKRENLDQKQILIAELCAIHPFPASLWRQVVRLPCILYRINALLLADQIRRQVALAINLSVEHLAEDFEWPPLEYGWNLADVLKKSKEKAKELEESKETKKIKEAEKAKEEEEKNKSDDESEIGTQSNKMLNTAPINHDSEYNLGNVPCGSSTYDSKFDDDDTDCSDDFDDGMNESSDNVGVIEYRGDNVAEAIDRKGVAELDKLNCIKMKEMSALMQWNFTEDDNDDSYHKHKEAHTENVKQNEERIMNEGLFITSDTAITFERRATKIQNIREVSRKHEDYVSTIAECFTHEVVNSTRCTYNKQAPSLQSSTLHPYTEGTFSFDYQPELRGHSGPSPSLILQALTMSHAKDGMDLERLETIGDSFLKYAITTYLFCTYNNVHEGKLSYLRSRQESNLNLYRIGRQKMLGENIVATAFVPRDNWLPPCYQVPKELEQAFIKSGVPAEMWNIAPSREIGDSAERLEIMKSKLDAAIKDPLCSFIPYNPVITQQSVSDKSIADCVEALIGAYLIACGPRGALLFMSWLGIHVLPAEQVSIIQEEMPEERPPGSTIYNQQINENGEKKWTHLRYKKLHDPPNPLFYNVTNPEIELEVMLDGYTRLEQSIGYHFRNRSYLLQAFTHATYQPNRLTDCYQRLEFLGDAVLDYLITRHLYEDPRQHFPGAITDLRSAMANNTIFALLAVRCGFHKYFRHLSPDLNAVIDRFVRIQEENGYSISEEYYFIDEAEEAEDVEVPKALGDVFEALAGAIYLDSNMSFDAVWKVYFEIMKSEIEKFSINVPKSPIRQLLELEPDKVKFSRPEKLTDGRRVRVTVDVFKKGSFKGIGRNYRIAKCAAAKCALRKLKQMQPSVRGRK